MRILPTIAVLWLLPMVVTRPVFAQTVTAPAALHAALPDYGGRDSALAAPPSSPVAAPTVALDPMGQAVRSVEALLIVLAIVVGAVMLLKKLGIARTWETSGGTRSLPGLAGRTAPSIGSLLAGVRAQPAPAGDAIQVLCTQPLGNQASVYLISVGDRTLLLGAAQGHPVNVLAEWDGSSEPQTSQSARRMPHEFRGSFGESGAPESEATAAADRLIALLNKSRTADSGIAPNPRGAR